MGSQPRSDLMRQTAARPCGPDFQRAMWFQRIGDFAKISGRGLGPGERVLARISLQIPLQETSAPRGPHDGDGLASQREAGAKVAMLGLFRFVTKEQLHGVHQCSCSNQVLLCTPQKQGAWREGLEGPPHLRKEERAVARHCTSLGWALGPGRTWTWVCIGEAASSGWALLSC